jgi:DNA-binding XRE family transcriptional regulator
MMQEWPDEWSAVDLKKWRLRLDMTQAEAAAQLGISLRAYTDRERGVSAIPRECMLACRMLELGARATP